MSVLGGKSESERQHVQAHVQGLWHTPPTKPADAPSGPRHGRHAISEPAENIARSDDYITGSRSPSTECTTARTQVAISAASALVESAPLARGVRAHAQHGRVHPEFVSADAANTVCGPFGKKPSDHSCSGLPVWMVVGSRLRLRGAQPSVLLSGGWLRIIPADAGSTLLDLRPYLLFGRFCFTFIARSADPRRHQQHRTHRSPCTLARALQHPTPPRRTRRPPTHQPTAANLMAKYT